MKLVGDGWGERRRKSGVAGVSARVRGSVRACVRGREHARARAKERASERERERETMARRHARWGAQSIDDHDVETHVSYAVN